MAEKGPSGDRRVAHAPDDTRGSGAAARTASDRDEADRSAVPVRRRLLRVLLPLAVLGLAAGLFLLLMATQPSITPREAAERVWPVSIVTVSFGEVQPDLELYGAIVAGREVELRPLVSGRVVGVGDNFADGGVVEEGDLLLRIDPFEYQAAVDEREAQLSEARALLAQLRAELQNERDQLPIDLEQQSLRAREVERREGLRARGSGSEKAVDDARIALNEQRQRVVQRRAQIAALEARILQQEAAVQRTEVALERARRDLRDTELRAPFSGFLGETNASVGKRVSTADRVAILTDASRLDAVFQLSDAQYGRLVGDRQLLGRQVAVVWETDSRPFTFDATIQRVAARISRESGGVDLHARLADTDIGTPIRPGAFVRVRLRDRRYQDVARLPDNALEDGERVYVVVDGRLEVRTVEIVGRDGNDVLVRGEIEEGESVIESPFPQAGPGVKVAVQ